MNGTKCILHPDSVYSRYEVLKVSSRGMYSKSLFISSNICLSVIFTAFTCLLLGLTGSRHICLLDCMHIDLMDMDLFTATRVDGSNQQSTSEFSYKSQVCLSACLAA